MDDVAVVAHLESREDLVEDGPCAEDRHRAVAIHDALECLATYELEDGVQIALGLAEIEDGHDPRMAELGEREGLAPEALAQDGVVEMRRLEDLDRHLFAEPLVATTVDAA